MGNRYYTFMLIPERSSRVKKWIIPVRATRWAIAIAAVLLVMGVGTSLMTLRYIARFGEFKQAQLKNHYLEAQIQTLQSRLRTADSTMVRIQNFEQKLRVLARVDQPLESTGFGPISGEDEEIMLKGKKDSESDILAAAKEVPSEYGYRMRSMELTIDGLTKRASLQEQSLQQLYELLKDQRSLLASTPSVWPVRGWVTSQFGYRISPFTGLRQLHNGLDIAAPEGTKIQATADGIVARVGSEDGYGKVVYVNHGYGIVTRYAHNSKITVKVGERVRRGQIIALIGNTGRVTGTHLHYEVRVSGIPVNPNRYILN